MNKLKVIPMVVLSTAILLAFNLKKEDKKKATAWTVDKPHTSVSFEVNHFFTPVKGSFADFNGILVFDPEDLSNSKADFTIKVESVSTQNEKRDNHLQSGDFFNAKEWPELKFAASSFTKKDDSNFVAHGKLTIRDVTREIELPFTILGIHDHPMKEGMELVGIRAETSLDRTDYSVGTGSWTATAVVGDEVKITILMEAMRKKEAA